MKTVKRASVLVFLAALYLPGSAFAQTDPGVQGGPARAGSPLGSVNSGDGTLQFFQNGQARFQDIESVTNSPTGNNGLGPRFNFVQCSGCHLQPAVGGTGPATNPQFQVIANGFVSGSTNTIPSFITANGPTREARFPFFFDQFGNPNPNSPNGGVEDLFTVSGRSDAGSCSLQQPSFALAQQANNIIFRIPTPTFGTGLMENLDDSTLLRNQAANANNNLGISGAFNHNGNDGTISRFGWKAQNKSLELFAGEAYNVEQGVSNELFQSERGFPPNPPPVSCLFNGTPEDHTNFDNSGAQIPSDVVGF